MRKPKQHPFYISIAIAVFFLLSCSSDNTQIVPVEPTVLAAVSYENISYGSDPKQVYDIYLPEGRSSATTKVLILVHGGGWTGGDKSAMASFIPIIQENYPDYAIVNMNYVLATASTPAFPNQILNIEQVLDQLTSKKETLQISPNFALIGVSVGAHISLIYDYHYDTDDRVKMVCDIVGPTDFTDPFYEANYDIDLLLSFLVDEESYPVGTNYLEELSPAFHVSSTSSPTILFYGDQDPLVPLTNGQLLNTKLEAAGVPHSFTVYEGGHGNWDVASFDDLFTKLDAFIAAHFSS